MAVPRKKVSRSRRNHRRSHRRAVAPTFGECPNCGEIKRPHHICSACGFYRDREVTEPKGSI